MAYSKIMSLYFMKLHFLEDVWSYMRIGPTSKNVGADTPNLFTDIRINLNKTYKTGRRWCLVKCVGMSNNITGVWWNNFESNFSRSCSTNASTSTTCTTFETAATSPTSAYESKQLRSRRFRYQWQSVNYFFSPRPIDPYREFDSTYW